VTSDNQAMASMILRLSLNNPFARVYFSGVRFKTANLASMKLQ